MTNELKFVFRGEDMKRLLQRDPDFIVVVSHLEAAVLQDGSKAGVVKVRADAVNKSIDEAVESIEGCPIPPCRTT